MNQEQKESTNPAVHSAKSVLCSAPPGVRTLDTLIKSFTDVAHKKRGVLP